MSLVERIDSDLRTAMKSSDKIAVSNLSKRPEPQGQDISVR